ncbi:MAG: ATP-binding protein [Actinomycetota bacterium]
MRLRTRLGLVMACIVALFVVATMLLNTTLARSSIYDSIDRLLESRVGLIGAADPSFDREELRSAAPDRFLEDAAIRLQLVDADGEVRFGDPDIPIDGDATATGGPTFRSLELDGRPFRVMTVVQPDGSVVQAATSTEPIEEGLADLQQAMLVIGSLLLGAAIVGGWWAAGRFLRPVVDVAAATRRLADNGTPITAPAMIETRRRDEVGDLVDGFNGLITSLRIAEEKREQLVGDASHELRTPLTSLRVKIDFLDAEPDLDAGQRRSLIRAAATELESLTTLVAELVALARGDEMEDSAGPVRLGTVVDEVADHARAMTGAAIRTETDDTVIVGREALIRRAVGNVVDNAIKYGPVDEPIDVVQCNGWIEVSDRGPGVPVDQRGRVFDRFYRSPQVHELPGSGIGLAIVRQAAEVHDGHTWVRDRLGGGAVVGFSMTSQNQMTCQNQASS